jgi:hypothetical protein
MSFDDHIEGLFAEYERQRGSITDLQARMKEVRASATSPRREVTVTVGRGGELTDIAFPTGAYKRLTPTELTSIILRTFGEAREQAMDQAAELLAPLLPAGMNAAQMVRGETGVDTYLPPGGPRMTSGARALLGLDPEQS